MLNPSQKELSKMKRLFAPNKLCWLMAAWWFATGGVSGAQTQAQTQTYYPETFAETTTAPESLTGDEWEETPQSQTHASFQKGSIRDTRQTRPHQIVLLSDILLDTLGLIGKDVWGRGRPFSLSARYHLPIVRNGFISSINNWIALEMGADFLIFFKKKGMESIMGFIPIEFMWAFRFSSSFAAYWKLGAGLLLAFQYGEFYFFPLPALQLGFMWDFSRLFHMRMEIGFPGLVRLGLGFGF